MLRALCLALLLAAGPALADPALFVVRGGAAPLYLFGSIHILRRDHAFTTPRLQAAFEEASACWFEDAEQPSLLMLLSLLPGMDFAHPLTPQLDPADRERLAQLVQQLMPGAMPVIDHMRPWLAALTLVAAQLGQRLDPDDGPGVDERLMAQARAAGKPVRGLETVASLVTLMNSLPGPDQLSMLHGLLAPPAPDQDAAERTQATSLEDAWQAGDLDQIARSAAAMDRASPELFTALLTRRNAIWAARLDALAHEGAPLLVTVGAAHLVGPGNLRELLAARGYRVERIH